LLARRAEALSKVSDACITAHKESGLQQGGKFASVQLDVSDKQQVAALWTKVPKTFVMSTFSVSLFTLETPI